MPERLTVYQQLHKKSENLRRALHTADFLEAKAVGSTANLEGMPAGADYLDAVAAFGANKQRIQSTIDTFLNRAKPVLEARLVEVSQHMADIRHTLGQLDQATQLHGQGILTESQLAKARLSAEAVEASKAQFLPTPRRWNPGGENPLDQSTTKKKAPSHPRPAIKSRRSPEQLQKDGFRRMTRGSGIWVRFLSAEEVSGQETGEKK